MANNISSYIIGAIIATLIVSGGLYIIADIAGHDPSFIESSEYTEFNNTFNIKQDLDSKVGNLTSSFDTEPEFGVFGVLNGLISTAWQSLRGIFSSFAFINSAINGMSSYFGIPAFIPQLFILIITVMIIFAIWGAIFQREL